jgi:tetratricopeptide (TPR) repeat protein
MIEVKKAHELEVVELTVDLPEYGVRRGARGTVVEVFDEPEEAYMIEFLENAGETSKLADWVKPEQIKNIDEVARSFYRKGMEALDEGKFADSLQSLRKAVTLIPSYLGGMHNSLAQSIGPHEDWRKFIFAMQLVRLIDPDYEMARENLAIGYLNLGVQEAKDGDYSQSIISFQAALAVEASSEIATLIKENIAASYTALGKKALGEDDIQRALSFFGLAHFIAANKLTRLNLGKAHFRFANFCSDRGTLQIAIDSYCRAEDAGLMWPEVLNNHACALAGSGRFEDATMIFEAAIALAPADNTIQSNLSKMLALRKLATSEMPRDLVTEDIEIDFPTPPMNTVPLLLVAA